MIAGRVQGEQTCFGGRDAGEAVPDEGLNEWPNRTDGGTIVGFPNRFDRAGLHDRVHEMFLRLGFTVALPQLRDQLDELLDDLRVVRDTAVGAQHLDGDGVSQPGTIRTVGGQRVEAVDNREDAGTEGDVRPFQAVRVARAVPPLVVMAHDRYDRVWELDQPEDLRSHGRVQLDDFELGGTEGPWLVQHV